MIDRWTESVRSLDQMRRDDAMRDFTQQIGYDTDFDSPGEWLDDSMINKEFNPESNPQIMSMHNHYVQALLDAHQVTTELKRTFNINDNK